MQSNYSAFKIFSLIHLTMTSPKNKQPSNFTHLISVISQISEQILFAYYSIIITVQINKLITLKFRFCIQSDGHVTPLNPFLFSVSFVQFNFFLAKSEKNLSRLVYQMQIYMQIPMPLCCRQNSLAACSRRMANRLRLFSGIDKDKIDSPSIGMN